MAIVFVLYFLSAWSFGTILYQTVEESHKYDNFKLALAGGCLAILGALLQVFIF